MHADSTGGVESTLSWSLVLSPCKGSSKPSFFATPYLALIFGLCHLYCNHNCRTSLNKYDLHRINIPSRAFGILSNIYGIEICHCYIWYYRLCRSFNRICMGLLILRWSHSTPSTITSETFLCTVLVLRQHTYGLRNVRRTITYITYGALLRSTTEDPFTNS
jgi:hypothetical protein